MAEDGNKKNKVSKADELRDEEFQAVSGGRDELLAHEATHVFQSDTPVEPTGAEQRDRFNGKYFVSGATHTDTSNQEGES